MKRLDPKKDYFCKKTYERHRKEDLRDMSRSGFLK